MVLFISVKTKVYGRLVDSSKNKSRLRVLKLPPTEVDPQHSERKLSEEEHTMGRPIYSYELDDPDLTWLIESFCEANPHYSCVQGGSLPVVLIGNGEPLFAGEADQPLQADEEIPAVPEGTEASVDLQDQPE